MKRISVAALVLVSCFVAPAAAEAPTRARALLYPEATQKGQEPPAIRIRVDGTPVSLYFPQHTLDSRPAVHLLTMPNELGLRVAEHTAYLYTTARAKAGETGTLTITLSDGRPLTFTVMLVAADAPADANVEVRLPEDATEIPQVCQAALQRAHDALAECRESDKKRAVELVASLLLDEPHQARPVEERAVHWRDKQNRIFVELVDAVRLFSRTYLRLSVENRDGSGKAWVAGDATITLVGPGTRRQALPVVAVFQLPSIPTGKTSMVVVSVRTPEVPEGASVRLALHEKNGSRHVVIDGVSL